MKQSLGITLLTASLEGSFVSFIVVSSAPRTVLIHSWRLINTCWMNSPRNRCSDLCFIDKEIERLLGTKGCSWDPDLFLPGSKTMLWAAPLHCSLCYTFSTYWGYGGFLWNELGLQSYSFHLLFPLASLFFFFLSPLSIPQTLIISKQRE